MQLVDRSQGHFDLKAVTPCLLGLPFALAVGTTEQPDGCRPANPARGRTLIAHPAAFVDGVACSLMPFVTDLSTTLATTRRAWLPGGRTWSIT